MAMLNRLIGASFVLFVGIMLALGWALLRARRAEERLRLANEETLAIQQTTLDASPMGIAYIDTGDLDNRRIITVNRQMATIFGYEPEMMPGLSVRRLYAAPDTYSRFTAMAPARLARGETIREEIVMQRRDGMPFWCALSIKAIDPDNLSRVVWTCEDITDRKAAEAALQQERSRAEAASRAKSEFLANMSHELRTPFTGLFGLLDLLAQSRLDANQRRHLELAHSSAMHMQAIVNDILDFSKIEAGKLIIEQAPFSLRQTIRQIADFHATAAERKGLRFILDVVEPLADQLVGDAMRIRQITDNLLSNAIKFTERGEIRLSVQAHLGKGNEATLRITVEDTGIGIPTAMQMRIFDKFQQGDSSTTRVYGGTGLGLAICKQLSTMMGGQISLSSAEGRGSRFSLTLRLPEHRSDGRAAAPAADVPTRLDGIVVLLAEDNPVNRGVMAETLELCGATVLTAENGEEAIRIASEQQPHIVLMDCQMPGTDGLEATRRIREIEAASIPLRRTPIIALTAFATTNYRELCLAEGMMDRFMSKPLNTRELLTTIRELVHRGTAKSPSACGRILLVDDNLPILEATQALLSRLGCEVVGVTDGRTALAQLESAGTSYDLVLMDCQMPVMNGWETTRRWRDRERALGQAPIAIIAVTADDSPEVRDRCREAGMNGTLVKPFYEDQLRTMLDDWLR